MITSIPIVDLEKICSTGNVKASASDWEDVAIQIRKNLHEVGFMYLINHGVPQDVVSYNIIYWLLEKKTDFYKWRQDYGQF